MFGADGCEVGVSSGSNVNKFSYCNSNRSSFKLPSAHGEGCEKDSSSINGGKKNFKSKSFEVYTVFVRITLLTFL
jgi:hypothetical protein